MSRVFDAPIITNDQSIDRLLAADLPVIILFWRGSEIPAAINQAMIDLAEREAGKLIVAKLKSDDNQTAAAQFKAGRELLLVTIRDGKEVSRTANPAPEDVTAHAAYVLGRADRPPERRKAAQRTASRGSAGQGADTRPVAVTDATFENMVLKADVPVVVDFWAPWCGPCHIVAPALDKLARDFAGRLRIAKVNVDQNPHFAGVYGVQGIPTLLMVRDGKIIDRQVGVLPEPHLRAKVEHVLLN